MRNPIIVALDTDDFDRAAKLIRILQPHVGGFKVGPRLTFRTEKSLLRELSKSGILFFDHKFFDIPTTTVSAAAAAAELGATWVTVHGLAGSECLRQLAELEKKTQKTLPEFKIVVVTVLTSFSPKTLPPIWKEQSIEDSVTSLAQCAVNEGLSSLVCSPEEVRLLRKKFAESFLIVPGVRPPGSDAGDQKRIATPREALDRGASALVIGRPIIDDPDPLDALRKILDTLQINK